MHFANVLVFHSGARAKTGTVARVPVAPNTATLATPFAKATRLAAATVNHIGTVTHVSVAASPSSFNVPDFILTERQYKKCAADFCLLAIAIDRYR